MQGGAPCNTGGTKLAAVACALCSSSLLGLHKEGDVSEHCFFNAWCRLFQLRMDSQEKGQQGGWHTSPKVPLQLLRGDGVKGGTRAVGRSFCIFDLCLKVRQHLLLLGEVPTDQQPQ